MFVGNSISEPNTVAMLEDAQHVLSGLSVAARRVPAERRWILQEPLRRHLMAISAAALAAQEAARKYSEAELLASDVSEQIQGMPFDVAADRSQEALVRLAYAAAGANEADVQLGVAILALRLAIGFALHGPVVYSFAEHLHSEMSTSETAAFLDCSKRHVQRLAKQGAIASRLHPDGSWRHRVMSVAEYLISTKRRSS